MSARDHRNNLSEEQLGRFVSVTRQHGGATMDARSGKILPAGARGYVVGGEPDKHGNRIPTTYVPEHEFGTEHVRQMANGVRKATGGRARVNVGSWISEGQVEMDASGRTKRPGEALRKGRNRGEKAIWNNKRMDEIKVSPKDEYRSQ